MKNKGIKFYSMIIGGFAGFIAYLLLGLHDFGLENVILKDALISGLFLGMLIFGICLFPIFTGKGSISNLFFGLFFGLLTFIGTSLIYMIIQSHLITSLAIALVGAIIGIMLISPLGAWIDKWKKDGYKSVQFRTLFLGLGSIVGLILTFLLPALNPNYPKGNWGIIPASALLVFYLGCLLDWIKSLFREKRKASGENSNADSNQVQ